MKTNYNIQVDLMKLAGARLEDGCICLPCQEDGPVVANGKSCFLKLTAFEMAQRREGMSHLIKPSLTVDQKSGIGLYGLRAMQYIGNMRPWDRPIDSKRPSICGYSETAQYAAGNFFLRCTHPAADARTTRDCSKIECPLKPLNR